MGSEKKTMRWIACILIILRFGVLDGRPMESFNRIQEQNTNIDQDSHPCPKESTSSYCLDPPGYPSSRIIEVLGNNPGIKQWNLSTYSHGRIRKKHNEILIKVFVLMQTT